MTIQQQMKATLEKAGIPFRQIEVYGSQIVVTSGCRDTAVKWGTLLGKFATVRRIMESIDDAKVNKKTCMNPSHVKVWRTFAVIA